MASITPAGHGRDPRTSDADKGEPPGGFLDRYRSRMAGLLDGLGAVPGLRAEKPDGAFYLFPSVEQVLGARRPDGRLLADDVEVAGYLLDAAGVATVPGSGFAAPGRLRLSFAASEDVLAKATAAIARAFRALVTGATAA